VTAEGGCSTVGWLIDLVIVMVIVRRLLAFRNGDRVAGSIVCQGVMSAERCGRHVCEVVDSRFLRVLAVPCLARWFFCQRLRPPKRCLHVFHLLLLILAVESFMFSAVDIRAGGRCADLIGEIVCTLLS
jgi:hypothetical protein